MNSVVKISFSILIFCTFIECKSSFADNESEKNRVDYTSNSKESDKKESNQWFSDAYLKNADKVYVKNIKTALLFKTGLEINEPVILLKSNETITLKFDDLDGYLKDYSYSIVHCNRNWEESGMIETEYLEGFFINPITDYKNAFNTLQNFIHYSLTFPNEDLKILRSGNYIIKVFLTSHSDEILLTKRFVVYESICQIKPQLKRTNDALERNYKQEIDFTITTNLSSTNQYDVVIKQNSRNDNMITGVEPVFYRGNELVYDLDIPNIFNGINEYRYLDLRRVPYTSDKIESIIQGDSTYEIKLYADASNGYKKYLTNQDINGNYLIQNQTNNIDEHHRESDYFWVDFYLSSPSPNTDGTVYLFGALSQWDFLPEYRMNYIDSLKSYHCKAFLKQGYYNYAYVLLEDNKKKINDIYFEGNHFETENNYSIFVYFKDISDNYDRVIGYKAFNTRTN